MLLAGDIGGTKTVLGLYDSELGKRKPIVQLRFPSESHQSFEQIIDKFLAANPATITQAVVGVAGPVINNQSTITNLNWHIDGGELTQRYGWRSATLLNDIAAIAHAVPVLSHSELAVMNEGIPAEKNPMAIIAPGTGMGEGFLIWKGDRYRSLASEGGHKSFGPHNEEQVALLSYLLPRFGHVSVERVCSGKGIPNLFGFLRDTGRYPTPTWLQEQLDEADDPTPIIVQAGLEERADICSATLDLFIDILANEAANLALQLVATGGVYLGGGIPPRIVGRLRNDDRFMRAFTDKGRFSDFLAQIPIHIILNANAALLGSAHYGLAGYAETH